MKSEGPGGTGNSRDVQPGTTRRPNEFGGPRPGSAAPPHLRLTLDELPIGAAIAALDYRLLHVNQTFCHITGYTPQELATFTFADITHPDDLPASIDMSARLRQGSLDHFQIDKRYIQKDGGTVWARTSVRMVNDECDQPWYFLILLEDVTQQRHAELELSRKQRTMSIILDSISEMFLYQTPDHKILWANKATADMLGRSLEDITGRYCYTVLHQQDHECEHCAFRQIRHTGQPGEMELTSADGRYLHIRGYPIKNADGQIEAMVEVVSDITQRKRAEQQLRALNDTLEQRVTERSALAERRANQMRDLALQLTQTEQKERRRVAHILHDHFQQVLVAAKFGTGLLHRHPERPAGPVLEQIERAIDEAIRVCRSLTVELCPPILYDVGLAQAIHWLGRWMHERQGLSVHVSVDPACEPIEEDLREMLFHATRELLFNVVKHAGVKSARLEMTNGENQIQILVADEGIGFDPAVFHQEQQNGSSGYGLFSIRERLEQLGGRLEIRTAPGQGTRASLIVSTKPSGTKA